MLPPQNKQTYFIKTFVFVCVCFSECVPNVCSVLRGQKRISKLELVTGGHKLPDVATGNQPGSYVRTLSTRNYQAISSDPDKNS